MPREVFAIAGSVLPSVIVPLTLKTMVSVPVPSAQSPPVVSTPGLFALLIASRRLQSPSPEVLCPERVDDHRREELVRADVAGAVSGSWPRIAALVGRDGAMGKRDRRDRGTGGLKRDGLGGPAVIGQAVG